MDENNINDFDENRECTDESVIDDLNEENLNSVANKKGKKKKVIKGIVRIAAIFVLACLVMQFVSEVFLFHEESGVADEGNYPYIAGIYVEGTIQEGNVNYLGQAVGYQHQWTLDTIEELTYDRNNKGLIIFIDSPGGGVYESDELYFKIKEYREYTGNPVYAVMGSTAASGGYYISAPCDKIYANRNTWTGSIGVTIGTMVDISGLLEQYGVKTTTITSGANKAMGSSYRPMSDEEKDIWQGLVDEAYDQFVDIVAEGRGLDKDYVYEIADGRILSASQAIELGLVDEIGDIDDATFDMISEIGDFSILRWDLRYEEPKFSFSTFLSGLANIESRNEQDVDGIFSLVNSINTTPVSYYCEIL